MATNAYRPSSSRLVTAPCALPAPFRSMPGATRGVVHARERAADEPGEHEVLGPPLDLSRKRASTQRAVRVTRSIDGDVELGVHVGQSARDEPTGVVRTVT